MTKIAKISLLFLLVLVSCTEEKVEKIKYTQSDSLAIANMPDQISYDFDVFFIDSSHTKVKLSAGRARMYQKRKETLLDTNIVANFMSEESGERVSVLTADSAKIDDRTKNMLAMGNVVVYSDSTQTTLKTTILEWDNAKQELYTTEFVVIDSPTEHVEGYGFRSDQNLENYTIFKISIDQKPNKID